MTTVILVEGTFGGEWARAKSPFCRLLRAHDFAPIRFQGWTGNVSGVPNILSKGHHRDWIAGGYALAYFLDRLDYNDRNLVVHSHGLNPVLYGIVREQVRIRRLISVCSPVRRDMQTQASGAAPRIDRWRAVSSSDWDFWQWAGEVFDGHVQFSRQRCWPQAHENTPIARIGHSKLLNDHTFLDLWRTEGMFDFLRAERVMNAKPQSV